MSLLVQSSQFTDLIGKCAAPSLCPTQPSLGDFLTISATIELYDYFFKQ